jgi:hypothetical protein
MIVSTQQGEMMIEAGQKITLAQADMDVGAPQEIETIDEKEGKEETAGMSKNQNIILGAIGGAAVVVGGALLFGGGGGGSSGGGGGDNDNGGSVSPSSP